MNVPRSAASDLGFFSKSKASKTAGSGTTVTVTKRVVSVKKTPTPVGTPAPSGSVHIVARDGAPSTSTTIPHKRKPNVFTHPLRSKRSRTSASPSVEPSSRASSMVPSVHTAPTRDASPLPKRRKSPSLSVSVMSTPEPQEMKMRTSRQWWIEEDGVPGDRFLSYETVVRDDIKDYVPYFRNPEDPHDKSFEPHPTGYPVVDLEFPNTGACERFALLIPRDSERYSPIQSLESSLLTILEFYLTPQQRSLFGTMPNERFQDTTDDDPLPNAPSPTPSFHLEALHSTVSTPSSDSSSISLSSSTSASSISSVTSVTSIVSSVSSLSSIIALQHLASQSYSGQQCVDYLKLFQRALNRRDGPLFLKVMDAINALLRAFKYPSLPPDPFEQPLHNVIRNAVQSWHSTSIPDKIVTQILGEAYDRAVKPHFDELKKYTAFSSEVYGELLPPFISDIIHITRLNENSLFLDLGSGVGNVCLQTSLATGCRSYGIEVLSSPAKIARKQLEQFQIRCRMWGLQMGPVELEEGDMLESKRVVELLPQADVVLVNNKVFSAELNDALRAKFLDLKEGAIVVSLESFSHGATRGNDIGNIFETKEKRYREGSVSWTGKGGPYYFQRVNRQRAFAPDTSSSRSSRSTRSSRR